MGLLVVVQWMVVVTPHHRVFMCLFIANMLLIGGRRSNNLIATDIWKKTSKSLALRMLGRRRLASCFLLLLLFLFSWTWLSFLIFFFLKFWYSSSENSQCCALFFSDNCMYVQYVIFMLLVTVVWGNLFC